jgi:peptidoglycan/LPS O-acetylase OafA/YrhL
LFDHLGTRIRGGYIGVDVFFVISGYLISAVIMRDIRSGTFSISQFYERRIRRIFPALLVMLAGCSVLVYLCFVPAEVEAFTRSLLAALCSVSNILFWHQAGYFDAPSEMKPLLHTWSLAVEEQFYLVFPLFLLFVTRWLPGRIKSAIWLATGISFAGACFWTFHHPATAFFWAPLRAWELLMGTVLSQGYLPVTLWKKARNLSSMTGLLCILGPALLYSARTPFPGMAAVPPCLGAVLIIAAGEQGSSLVGKMLSLKPVVFVGLISYSLYLWHWPLIVFQRTNYILIDAPPGSKVVKVTIFLFSLVLATLSWALVETPFRRGRWKPGRPALFAINGVGFALLLLLCVRIAATHGFASRFPAQALAVDRYTRFDPTSAFREDVCFLGPEDFFAQFNKTTCLLPAPHSSPLRPQYLLLGDSHAAQLYPGLASTFPEIDLSQANTASCRPFLTQMDQRGACGDLYRFIFGDYLKSHRPAAILLAGRWDESEFEPLGKTVQWLKDHGQHVILFGPGIEFNVPLPRLLALALRDNTSTRVEAHRSLEPFLADVKLAVLARQVWHIDYISAYEDLCTWSAQTSVKQKGDLPVCPVFAAPGVPILFDADHMTPEGSALYARAIRQHHQLP